ncbi:Vacuolar protein sorting-associated protein 37A [Gracilariopsis chorda]|uniref:Vacuolar protein sorting-associated protein 37A n=1 Tax=Gracilariopsis chorda TaxID=448386 RepID=A0A2V3J1H9_9FLOR|nr:Vacuolar protein sorting-associated protein 37A [Gracilariopsis chorda]|eukprot:PXF47817.1 Vacuolar protein sorting-associated protein 37A [Gracilariopsis chorda]
MWTGSSGAYRASQSTQPTGDASHPPWNSQDARGTGYMWERDEVSNRVSHRSSPSSTTNSGLDASQSGPYSGPRAPEVDASADGLPDPPKSFPELESMSLRDLRLLHEERARFDDFVSKHQYQQQLDSIVSKVRANVDALEREHVTITARMDEAVDDEALEKLRRDVAELEKEVQALHKQKEEWLGQNSPERLMERLRTAMRESESTSEALEKNMLSSSMHFDEFLSQYIACRQKYHERSLKLEQLQMEVKKKSFGR